MSQPRKAVLRLTSFAGGLNDTDPTHRIGDDQLATAFDVLLTPSGGVQRRPGAQVAMTHPTTGMVFPLLVRHTPSQALSSSEVWAAGDGASNFYRSASGTTFSSVALAEAASATAMSVTDAASFNGKLFFAYKKNSGADRLHCWDGTSIRRVGISTPSAPTAADTGTGSYAATLRYYKVQFVLIDGTSSKRTYSEMSSALSFTPSGSGTAARITKPTTPDGATHWLVWASPDNVSYYLISGAIVVATTTFDDVYAPSAYVTVSPATSAPLAGEFTPPWSAKYLLVDDNRLIIAGAFDNTRYVSRIGWSAIGGSGSSATGLDGVQDDERFPVNNYLDLDADEGGDLTGMELLDGSVYVFKRFAIYKLVRTGNLDRPYLPVTISKGAGIGALSRKSIVLGEDESGAPCLYFLSDRGPYRIGANGLQYLGRDIETTWASVKRTSYTIAPHGVYDPSVGIVHWFVPRSENYPDTRLSFHVRLARPTERGVRGGWTRTYTPTSLPMYVSASAMLPSDLSSRGSALAPHAIHYAGAHTYPPVVWKYSTTSATDAVLNSSGAVIGSESTRPRFATKTFSLGLGEHGGVDDVYVLCGATYTTSPELEVLISRDFGAETRTKYQTYTGDTLRQAKQVHGLEMAQAQYVSLSITDSTSYDWTIDEIAIRVRSEDPL